MAIPNLIALLALSGVVVRETKRYFRHAALGDLNEVDGLQPETEEEYAQQPQAAVEKA